MSIKWNFDGEFNFSNTNFARIYRFFVIETPVEDVSRRGISFKQRGWNLNSLNATLKRTISFLKTDWYVCVAKDVEYQMQTNGIYDSVEMPKEIAIHTVRDKSNTIGLFYAIRCAFAHGAFVVHTCKGEKYYFLENKDKGQYKGRIVIKENSLISMIEIVESKLPMISSKKNRSERKGSRKKALLLV